jgi:hypothetical protein
MKVTYYAVKVFSDAIRIWFFKGSNIKYPLHILLWHHQTKPFKVMNYWTGRKNPHRNSDVTATNGTNDTYFLGLQFVMTSTGN